MISLRDIRPAHIQAGLSLNRVEEHEFRIEIRVFREIGVFLFATLTLQEQEERAHIGVMGRAEGDVVEDLYELDEEQIVRLVTESRIEHVLYDTAAMVARQACATLNFSLPVPDMTMNSAISVTVRDSIDLEPNEEQ